MRLPFFRPKDQASEPQPPEPPRRKGRAGRSAGAELPLDDAAIAAARTQARRRLVGAVVLLAVGVIGFPLLFETQPRPLPQDTPVVVAADALANRPVAAVRPVLPEVPADAGVEPVASAPLAAPGAAVPASAPARPAAPAAERTPAPGPQPKPAPPTPAPAPVSPATRVATTPPATASAPAAARWVVQVGAYNDPERLKAARAKLQLLGYASYTQEVDSPTGRRTRVRVGPFKTRAEAETVAKRVKTGGLQAAVLSI